MMKLGERSEKLPRKRRGGESSITSYRGQRALNSNSRPLVIWRAEKMKEGAGSPRVFREEGR